jgi:integrase
MKYNILFFLDKDKTSISDGKLRMRVRWDKNVVNFNLGYRVEFSKWSTDTQRCKINTSHGKKLIPARVINNEINRYQSAVENVFDGFSFPSTEQVRHSINVETGKEKEKSEKLFDLFDLFINSMSRQNNWAKNTTIKFKTLKTHLISFDKSMLFDKITDDYFQNFMQYLLSIKQKNTTVSKNLSLFRWFLRWAVKNGYYLGNSHNSFKPRFKGIENKEVVYLSWEELQKLYSFEFPENKKYLSRVRDIFCFCCFTSLRYSDVQKLQKSDIKGDYFTVITKKTSEGLKIELNDYSRAILAKYANSTFEKDLALPVISLTKMNEYIKEMGKMTSIDTPQRVVYFSGNQRHEEIYKKWQLLTTHCGRRTFICNAFFLGIPAEVIMSWTGHADYKAMRPYIKIVDKLKEKEMSKFNFSPSF